MKNSLPRSGVLAMACALLGFGLPATAEAAGKASIVRLIAQPWVISEGSSGAPVVAQLQGDSEMTFGGFSEVTFTTSSGELLKLPMSTTNDKMSIEDRDKPFRAYLPILRQGSPIPFYGYSLRSLPAGLSSFTVSMELVALGPDPIDKAPRVAVSVSGPVLYGAPVYKNLALIECSNALESESGLRIEQLSHRLLEWVRVPLKLKCDKRKPGFYRIRRGAKPPVEAFFVTRPLV
jgi:hypothetical protein